MISPKFVSIAREVIKFIRKGHQLRYTDIIYYNNKCCPLGAVCYNNGYSVDPCEEGVSALYKFAYTKTGLDSEFYNGFDRYQWDIDFDLNNPDYKLEENFIIGFKLAEMCSKRNWIAG